MSLYDNINKRKKAGTSRSKKDSTITPEAYANMKAGFPKKKRKKAYGGGNQERKMYNTGGYASISDMEKSCDSKAKSYK